MSTPSKSNVDPVLVGRLFNIKTNWKRRAVIVATFPVLFAVNEFSALIWLIQSIWFSLISPIELIWKPRLSKPEKFSVTAHILMIPIFWLAGLTMTAIMLCVQVVTVQAGLVKTTAHYWTTSEKYNRHEGD